LCVQVVLFACWRVVWGSFAVLHAVLSAMLETRDELSVLETACRAVFCMCRWCSDCTVLETLLHGLTQAQLSSAELCCCCAACPGDDVAASLGATRSSSNTELSFARGLFLLNCRAAHVQAIDIVTVRYNAWTSWSDKLASHIQQGRGHPLKAGADGFHHSPHVTCLQLDWPASMC
jgi:citrate lyase beta subunit